MSTPEPVPANGMAVLADYPSFELEYYLDDNDAPSTIIVCSTESAGSIATEWITIDIAHAVPVEDVR